MGSPRGGFVVASQNDLRRLRALQGALRTVDASARCGLGPVLPALRELLEADAAVSFGVAGEGEHLSLENVAAAGLSAERLARELEPIARDHPRFAHFDPSRPEPAQRNRVLSCAELVRAPPPAPVREALDALGLGGKDFLRVLICESGELLAWVGVFRASAFGPRERRLFGELVPDLKQRLHLDRELCRAKVAKEAIAIALERLPRPALLADARGRVVLSNAVAARWLSSSPESARAAIRQSLAGGSEALEANEIDSPGLPRHWLIVAREDRGRDPIARAAQLARALALTPRQGDVLEGLLRGASNKAIGLELSCAVKTVELHVSAILRKARVKSRAELLATLAPLGARPEA